MLERFKVPEKDRVYVPEGQIRTTTEAIFRHSGVSTDEATRVGSRASRSPSAHTEEFREGRSPGQEVTAG